MCERCEELADALRRIMQWAEAYPVDIFHKPDAAECKRAHDLLTANGMTLDAFSASMGRHCLKEVGEIARRALGSEARLNIAENGIYPESGCER